MRVIALGGFDSCLFRPDVRFRCKVGVEKGDLLLGESFRLPFIETAFHQTFDVAVRVKCNGFVHGSIVQAFLIASLLFPRSLCSSFH